MKTEDPVPLLDRPEAPRLLCRGLIGTAVYLALVAAVICATGRTAELANMKLGDWGTFVGGVLGPLALFWVILTFRLQQHELRQNTEALRLQAEEFRNQVEATRDLVALDRTRLEGEQARSEARFIVGHRPTRIGEGTVSISFQNRGGDATEINFGGPNGSPKRVPILTGKAGTSVTMPWVQGQESTMDFVYTDASGQWEDAILVNRDGEVRLVGRTKIR